MCFNWGKKDKYSQLTREEVTDAIFELERELKALEEKIYSTGDEVSKLMAMGAVEDETGSIEFLAFETALQAGGSSCKEGMPAVLYGRISSREDEAVKLVCEIIRPLDEDMSYDFPSLRAANMSLQAYRDSKRGGTALPRNRSLYIRLKSESDPRRADLLRLLQLYPGHSSVCLFYSDTRKTETPSFYVQDCGTLLKKLCVMFEEEDVVFKFNKR